jgi:hypothetical protein
VALHFCDSGRWIGTPPRLHIAGIAHERHRIGKPEEGAEGQAADSVGSTQVPFFEPADDDVYRVPISITRDQLLIRIWFLRARMYSALLRENWFSVPLIMIRCSQNGSRAVNRQVLPVDSVCARGRLWAGSRQYR